MQTEETKNLLERWHQLQAEPVHASGGDEAAVRARLQERVDILHRLNELSEYTIDGIPIVQALEETNILLREVDRAQYTPAPLL